jgi:hypothetical protein
MAKRIKKKHDLDNNMQENKDRAQLIQPIIGG